MQQIIEKTHNSVKTICQPNSKLYPDPILRQLAWNRNIKGFYSNAGYLVLSSFFLMFTKFSLPLNIMLMVPSSTLLVLFIILCRSYLWIFNMIYALTLFLFFFLALYWIPDAVYLYIGYMLALPILLVIRTGDPKVTFFAGTTQTLTILTKFKERLIIAAKEEDPEIFADKYVKITLCFLLFALLGSFSLVKTLEKQTIELSRAKNALEVALDQQKTFIFSFSHELRNPINSLLGNLQLVLQGEALSAKAAEMIGIAKVCGEILLHNINNVLDTGKYDIGKLEVNPVPTQLYELFQKTWGIYSEPLRQKKLKSQLRIDKGLPVQVKIDPHKVNQILMNLLGNSIKFTEKGSVSVTIKWLKYREVSDKCFEPIPYDDTEEGLFEKQENLSTVSISRFSEIKPGFLGISEERRQVDYNGAVYPSQETKGVLKIIVKDTGSGMKKEALEKLFKKFSQVSENISQRHIGTGLGLFITKEICNTMKGEIRAYSKVGVGSTFVICIPTLAIPLRGRQRADSQSIIQILTEKRLQTIVADDSPFNANLTCDYLGKFGASVVSVAYNGYDAYMKYRECMMTHVHIDLILLDIDMPIMDGHTACEKIRGYEKANKLKPVPIILMSGNYDADQAEEDVNLDDDDDQRRHYKADCFLRKPVEFSDFSREIYNLFIL